MNDNVPLDRQAYRDLSLSGALGAAALLLPTVFHLLALGSVFMPMYLPLVLLAFLVRPQWAVMTAFMIPLLSSLVTGMPPLVPPIAAIMSCELGAMAGLIAFMTKRFPTINIYALLVPVLVIGRLLNAGMAFGAALLFALPARFLAGISFLAGWPGIILMVIVIPPMVLIARSRGAVHG